MVFWLFDCVHVVCILFSLPRKEVSSSAHNRKGGSMMLAIGTKASDFYPDGSERNGLIPVWSILNWRKTGYVPLPMLRTSDGFSASFGSSTTKFSFMLVKVPPFCTHGA